MIFCDLLDSIAHIEGAGRFVPFLRTPTYTFSVRNTVPIGMSTRAVTVQLVGLFSFAWRYFRMSAVFSETAKPPVILDVVKRKKCPRWKRVVDMPRGGGRFGRAGRLPRNNLVRSSRLYSRQAYRNGRHDVVVEVQ